MQFLSPSSMKTNISVVGSLRARLLGDINSPTKQEAVILVVLFCALFFVLVFIIAACSNWLCPTINPAANKGLKKKARNSLPRQTCTTDDAVKFSDCAICLAEFVPGDQMRVLPACGHCYHVSCIDVWLRNHSSCPSCRQSLAGANKSGRVPVESSAPLRTSILDASCLFIGIP